MAIFGKDKPAGDTQPEAVQSGQKPESAMGEQIVRTTLQSDVAEVPPTEKTTEWGTGWQAGESHRVTWVTLKTDHTYAGDQHVAGSKVYVDENDVETLRHLGAID